MPRYGDICHLERHVLGVLRDRCTDLDELRIPLGQRPLPQVLGKYPPSEEVLDVMGQRKECQPGAVRPEGLAEESRPSDGILALLDPLLRRSATIVEPDHYPCPLSEICDEEAHAWRQLDSVPLPYTRNLYDGLS